MYRIICIRPNWIILLFAIAVGSTGCFNGGEAAIDLPPVVPEKASAAAMAAYDKDGNGALDKTELAACPGLLPALGNKPQLSRDDITAHLQSMYGSGVGMMSAACIVRLDERLLAGAKVTIEPESFLSDSLRTAEGTSSDSGKTILAISDDQLPENEKGLQAVQPGIYKVKITHPSQNIPAKYNTETTLGMEVNPTSRDEPAVFSIKSK